MFLVIFSLKSKILSKYFHLDLGVRKNEKKGLSPNFTSAEILLKELISKRDKIHSTSIKKSLLLKFITTVYIDCINRRKENKTSLQAPLHLILYEYFLNKYGLKKTAEKKLKQVACYKFFFHFR